MRCEQTYVRGISGPVFLCGRGPAARQIKLEDLPNCSQCGARYTTLLCDWPIHPRDGTGRDPDPANHTCSEPLCSSCTVRVNKKDYGLHHVYPDREAAVPA